MERTRRILVLLGLLATASPIAAQDPLDVPLLRRLEARVGHALQAVTLYGSDSVLVVFQDSTLTGAALQAKTWRFGPRTSAAAVDSEMRFGQDVARFVWHELGMPQRLQRVIIRVNGAVGKDRWTHTDFFYYRRHFAA
jgi:hypothetical protein